jgi:sugar lactone lactonase YvrE
MHGVEAVESYLQDTQRKVRDVLFVAMKSDDMLDVLRAALEREDSRFQLKRFPRLIDQLVTEARRGLANYRRHFEQMRDKQAALVAQLLDLTGTAVTLTHSWSSTMCVGALTTLAGSGAQGFADSQGTAAQFSSPQGIAVASDDTVYVADSNNHRVRKITAEGAVTTLAGSGTAGFADGQGTAAQFNHPNGIAVANDGTVYVADCGNHLVRKITAEGAVTTLAGSGAQGFADGQGSAAQFSSPYGIAVAGDGTIYVADCGNVRIRKITAEGAVTTLAGRAHGFADGQGTAAQFSSPQGIAVAGDGTVYVADCGNHCVRKITAEGAVTTLAGNGMAGFADSQGRGAQFSSPQGIAVAGDGTVYVADCGNHRVRKITAEGAVTTLAGSTKGFGDGHGAAAAFANPKGIALTPLGDWVVTDTSNHCIRCVVLLASTVTLDVEKVVGVVAEIYEPARVMQVFRVDLPQRVEKVVRRYLTETTEDECNAQRLELLAQLERVQVATQGIRKLADAVHTLTEV